MCVRVTIQLSNDWNFLRFNDLLISMRFVDMILCLFLMSQCNKIKTRSFVYFSFIKCFRYTASSVKSQSLNRIKSGWACVNFLIRFVFSKVKTEARYDI